MATEKMQQPTPRKPRLSPAILIPLIVIIVLELIFTIFSIPAGGRPLTLFDMQVGLAVIILAMVRPKLFSRGWTSELSELPIPYKIYVAVTLYFAVIRHSIIWGFSPRSSSSIRAESLQKTNL